MEKRIPATMLTHNSPVPLDHQLSNIIHSKIRSGEYAVGVERIERGSTVRKMTSITAIVHNIGSSFLIAHVRCWLVQSRTNRQ